MELRYLNIKCYDYVLLYSKSYDYIIYICYLL